ncbi:MAG: hypothetical protein ACD_79C01419G0001, partial [uncultured bacterium]
CRIDGTIDADRRVNIGAVTDYAKNITDSRVYNSMQSANDDANTGAGDTITTYAIDEQSNLLIGATITDLGSMVSFSVADGVIPSDDYYIGHYVYIKAGANFAKHYLIVDSDATADTITILTSDASGFHQNDIFNIVDRIYNRLGAYSYVAASYTYNLFVNNDGTASNPIKWNTNGTVIVDGKNEFMYGIGTQAGGGVAHNIYDGFILCNNTGASFRFSMNINAIIWKNNIIHDSGMAFSRSSGFDTNTVIDNNILYNNHIYSIGEVISNNKIFKCPANAIASVASAKVINNSIFGNTQYGSRNDWGASNDFIGNKFFVNGIAGISVRMNNDGCLTVNNTFVKNGQRGLYLYDDGVDFPDNNIIRNNIVMGHTTAGISVSAAGVGNTSDFNFFYNNTANTAGIAEGANSITGTAPSFYSNDTGTSDVSSTTTMIIDAGKIWTANQWQGYALKITISGTDYWAGVISNTSDRLYLTPALSVTPNAGDSYVITDLSIAGTPEGNVTPLGQGCRADGATEPGTVSIGAYKGMVRNDTDTRIFNSIQNAHDDANTNAGDTVTIHAIDEVVAGTVGAAITDLGPLVQIDVDDATITASRQYEGMYMVMTNGVNQGKSYLIVDSTEAATDTIIILTDSVTGFTANTDTFTITDRIYDELNHVSANISLSKNGALNSNWISFTRSGTVVLDAASSKDYNVFANAGLDKTRISSSILYNNYNT